MTPIITDTSGENLQVSQRYRGNLCMPWIRVLLYSENRSTQYPADIVPDRKPSMKRSGVGDHERSNGPFRPTRPRSRNHASIRRRVRRKGCARASRNERKRPPARWSQPPSQGTTPRTSGAHRFVDTSIRDAIV
jgi:hypothetical protein